MLSASGRFVLTYNGEVYNAGELRAELEQKGHSFRGHSDTEVLVEGFAAWGVRATVERLIGMFAFAVFDKATSDADAWARPARHQAALLGPRRRARRVRLGAEGARPLPDFAPAIDRQALGRLSLHRLRAGAAQHLSRVSKS